MKSLFLLFVSVAFFTNLFSQQIDEGIYNDWDYGPNGVHGNLPLVKITARKYYKIEKSGPQTVRVQHFNPSGVVINTTSVTFVSGVLNKVEIMNQWGEIYEYRNFTQKDKDEFQVTDLLWGVNNFLPCKYAKYIYKNELLSEVQYYSIAGNLAENKNGYAIVRYKRYDDKTRFAEIKEMSFYDREDNPVISKTTNYHTLVNVYDNNDNKISESYLGIRDEPITLQESTQAGAQFVYDEDNNRIKVEFHGLDNQVITNINGIAGTEFQYNLGYEVRSTHFDSLHQPTLSLASGDGICTVKYEYDSSGNKIKEASFDEGDRPMIDHSGVHETVSVYSSSNMLVRISFFDELGNPCLNRDNVHGIAYVRDEMGRIIQESTYGRMEEPLINYHDRVYLLKYKYDEYGRRFFISYWLDSLRMMPRWSGAWQQTIKFDDDGRPVEYNFLGPNGKPSFMPEGSTVSKLVYNEDGRLGERRFLNNTDMIKTGELKSLLFGGRIRTR
jgi:hypothetical protein